MSTIARSREPQSRDLPLAARAVRLRNVCLRAIAGRRGLAEPSPSDLAQLQPDVTLSAAVRWWQGVQRDRHAAQQGVAPVRTSAWSNMLIRAAAISLLLAFALLAFPRELAGSHPKLTVHERPDRA